MGHEWQMLCGFGDESPINFRCGRCGRLSAPLSPTVGPLWPWPRCTALTKEALTVEQITTAEELDALLSIAAAAGEPVVVQEGGFRIWTLTEDDNGQWWGWSWREEGEDWRPRPAEDLRLPLKLLYRPDAVADMYPHAEPRCPRCGGTNGAHGFIHVRHGNGGGNNKPCPIGDQVITSLVAGKAMYKVVLDIDLPVVLVPSTTSGHFHLYIDHEIDHERYFALLKALSEAGVIEPGYLRASEDRGYTAVRLPWVRKPTTAEPGRDLY